MRAGARSLSVRPAPRRLPVETPGVNPLQHLFDRNRAWALRVAEKDPEFFPRLAREQRPKYLWIGCADSRVPANQIVDLPPGRLFVHRNIGNLVVHTDLNCLSVIQFGVEILQVEHVIVCGHYGCSGVRSALEDRAHGLADNWLRHLKDVMRFNRRELEGLPSARRFDRLCELNVMEQVTNVANTSIMRNAWKRGAEITVHGWIYDIGNGLVKDLGVSLDHPLQPEY